MAGTDHANDVLLWTTLYRLKTIPRTGWVDRGIPAAEAETVADHSLLTALLSWVAAHGDSTLDTNRVLQMAMIHDTAEAIAGDIPPYDPQDIPADPEERRAFFAVRRIRTPENAERKRAIEEHAATQLINLIPAGVREEWQSLWDEYEAQATPEAQLVKQVDKLEAFLQSRLYAAQYPDAPVEGFTDMALQAITHPLLVPIRDAFLAAEKNSAV